MITTTLRQFFTTAFLILSILLNTPKIFGQTDDSNEMERLNLLKKNLREQLQKEKNIKLEQTKTLNEISEIEKNLSDISQEIFKINSQLINLENEYKKISIKIEEINKNLQTSQKILAERLKTYINTIHIGIFNILFSSKSFIDLYTKNIYLKYILTHDANLKENYKKELNDLRVNIIALEKTKKSFENKKRELEINKESLKKIKEEKELYWKHLTQSQEEYAKMIKELRLAIKDLENTISKTQPNTSIDTGIIHKLDIKTEIDTKSLQSQFIKMKGKLQLPTEGKIVKNPIKESLGIVIEAPIGSEIRSPADGIISHNGSHPGYGNFVIIDHGDGYRTLIAQGLKFFVEIGQQVTMGELLGFSSGGPWNKNGIYVELQKDQRPINAKEWFNIR